MPKYRAVIAGVDSEDVTTVIRPSIAEAAAYFARVWGDENVLSVERIS